MKIVFLITLLVSSATAANERLAGRHARASAGAAKPGEEFLKQAALFHQKCSKCHTIGKGDRVGPDLKGVTGKREKNWLVGFISRPGEYLDTDPVAKELLEKYNGVRMDDAGLNAQQAEGLLTYIETFSAGANGGDDEPELLEEESFTKRVVMPDESGGIPLVALAGPGNVAARSLRLCWPCSPWPTGTGPWAGTAITGTSAITRATPLSSPLRFHTSCTRATWRSPASTAITARRRAKSPECRP